METIDFSRPYNTYIYIYIYIYVCVRARAVGKTVFINSGERSILCSEILNIVSPMTVTIRNFTPTIPKQTVSRFWNGPQTCYYREDGVSIIRTFRRRAKWKSIPPSFPYVSPFLVLFRENKNVIRSQAKLYTGYNPPPHDPRLD